VCSPAYTHRSARNTKMMTPIETYKMALETMSREELIEYTALLLRSLDKLGITPDEKGDLCRNLNLQSDNRLR